MFLSSLLCCKLSKVYCIRRFANELKLTVIQEGRHLNRSPEPLGHNLNKLGKGLIKDV